MNEDFKYQTKQGNSDFLKIADGESVTLRLLSETFHRYQVTRDNELVDTRDWEAEDFAKATSDDSYKLRDRFIWIVFNRETETAQIYEVGASIYNQLKNLAFDNDWGDPRKYDVKVTRTGEKLDTKYAVVPSKNTDETTEEMDNAGLELDIEKIVKHSQPLRNLADSE